MKKLYLLPAALLICLAMAVPARAQRISSNDIFYHSFRSPIATRLNPALFPSSSNWYVTLPSVNAGAALPISYDDLGLQYNATGDTVVLNVNDLLRTLDSCGSRFGIDADIDLFGFGFKYDNMSITVDAGLRVNGSGGLPLGATRLATEGNLGSSDPIEMGCTDMLHLQAYSHLSLGASYMLPALPLTIGARANLLSGIATVSVDNLSLQLTSLDDGQQLQVAADYLIHSAGMAYLTVDEEGNFGYGMDSLPDLNHHNWGCTFDLGVNYEYNDFNFSASLLDVGPGIHWTNHTTTIVPKHQDATLSFDGIDISPLITDGKLDSTFTNALSDSLLSLVDYQTEESDFWAGVPTHLYLGANYTVSRMLRVGYLFHGLWDKGLFFGNNTFRCNNTLSATGNLYDWLDVTLANSITFDGKAADLFNPGISVSLNLGRVFQLYLGVDYLSNIYATNIKAARLLFGCNIVGFRKQPTN